MRRSWLMLPGVFLLSAGCAAPASVEEKGDSVSHLDTGATTAASARELDLLEDKARDCNLLTPSDLTTLSRHTGMVDFTFEAYVSFKCSVREGAVVIGETSMETRAGWSSKDGTYTEESLDATASVEIPLRVVTASGSVTSSVSVRRAGATVTHNRSVAAAVGVSKDFGLATGSASVSLSGNDATISGGVSAPLRINVTDCTGEESVGVTVSLIASHVETAPPAIANRARAVLLRQEENFSFYREQGYFGEPTAQYLRDTREACCFKFDTCD